MCFLVRCSVTLYRYWINCAISCCNGLLPTSYIIWQYFAQTRLKSPWKYARHHVRVFIYNNDTSVHSQQGTNDNHCTCGVCDETTMIKPSVWISELFFFSTMIVYQTLCCCVRWLAHLMAFVLLLSSSKYLTVLTKIFEMIVLMLLITEKLGHIDGR